VDFLSTIQPLLDSYPGNNEQIRCAHNIQRGWQPPRLFNQGNGLIKQPAAPNHPPTIEIVAAGFLRLTHEQTVILLKAITPAASANSRHAMNQRKCDPISTRERAIQDYLLSNLVRPSQLSRSFDVEIGKKYLPWPYNL
jgi:hypothetical protein